MFVESRDRQGDNLDHNLQAEQPPSGGACTGHPTHWWFPYYYLKKASELNRIKHEVKMAKEICGTCDVRVECLDYSLRNEPWGIWGGEDEQARAHLRMKRKVKISREGAISYPGLGSTSADGESLALRLKALENGSRKRK